MELDNLPWIITLSGLGLIAVTFIIVALKSQQRIEDYPSVTRSAYKIRAIFFSVFLISGVAIAGLTLGDLPYGAHEELNKEAVMVNVMGHQWRWDIDRTELPVNTPVIFNVSSSDVNHGFAIYNDDLKLIAQTQAMPGYINKLTYTFDKTGTYKILCLEYCGLAHHSMLTELIVKK